MAASDALNSGALVTLAPHRTALLLLSEHVRFDPLASYSKSTSSRAVEALKVELGRHHPYHRGHRHLSVFLRFQLKFVGRNFPASFCTRCNVFDVLRVERPSKATSTELDEKDIAAHGNRRLLELKMWQANFSTYPTCLRFSLQQYPKRDSFAMPVSDFT